MRNGEGIQTEIMSHLAVIDSDALESPAPVPVHVDGRALCIVEGDVANSELSIAVSKDTNILLP